MSLRFKEEGHIYESDDGILWTGVTSFVGMFKKKFDPKKISEKSAKNKRSKWYGLTPKRIREIWENETKRAVDLGNWYHNERESDMLEFKTLERDGVSVPIFKPCIEEGVKIAPKQKLVDGIYPEHFVYLKSAGLCGQADRVEIVNGKINIIDYKTNKEIKEKSYVNWEGISDKMFNPISHLDNCNLIHYNLQLSIYAYIIKKHNPKLKIGNLVIQHVKFESEGEDEYGYPITKLSNGNPVIKDIKMYNLPYLKDEVLSMIMWLKDKQHQ
tara:strand:- start:611 stop:1420 length:810 start_codon:yes stop_codon:yes gene_type:complete